MGPPKKSRGVNKRKAQSPLLTPSPLSSLPDSPSTVNSPVTPPVRNLAMEAQIADISSKLDTICGKLQKMDIIESKLNQVESALCELKHENTYIREELASARSEISARDKTISSLTEQVNRLDQNARATSVRILGLPITAQTPPSEIFKIVYESVVHPCLEEAKKAGDIPAMYVPFPGRLIDSAFSIPAKTTTSLPVIVKFASLTTRTFLFKYKKVALPQIKDPNSNRMRNKYSIFEDLSPMNFNKLQLFSKDSRVKSAWSYNGQIRFKTHDSDTMYRVKTSSDTFESLVTPSTSRPMST
jgi:hypothetical protein